jgi:nicotinate-nucleotide pyrophosphorylase (carboxylating)
VTASFEALNVALYGDIVRSALSEDLGQGDKTTKATIETGKRGRGELRAKEWCVLAGVDIALEVFRQLDPAVLVVNKKSDGHECNRGDLVVTLEGQADALLTAERTALNFLQRLAGIATVTHRYVEAAAGRAIILDTRKTTPMIRVLEKYAVRAGGATNHRFALDDGLLIKDNHVRLAGSISTAVSRIRAGCAEMPIEVEAQTLSEVDEALESGVDIILLDNMTLDELHEAITRCRGRVMTEVSGGVTLERIDELAALQPTYISVGSLTHSAAAIDMSLDIRSVP